MYFPEISLFNQCDSKNKFAHKYYGHVPQSKSSAVSTVYSNIMHAKILYKYPNNTDLVVKRDAFEFTTSLCI